MNFQKMQWLFPLAVTLHNAEEGVWMPKWAARHNSQLPVHMLSAIELRSALFVLAMAAFAIT